MYDLIEDFVDATRNLKSPVIFRRWCAISMISAALGRKVHTSVLGGLPLYANTYVILVSPAGLGKSLPMDEVRNALVPLRDMVFSPDEITPQRMIMDLGEIFAPGVKDRDQTGHKTYIALISELGTFMPKPDVQFIQALARIWDCSPTYTRKTKGAGCDFIENHYMTIIAGAQPAWFAEGFPPNAYEMGLPSRLYLIYSEEQPYVENFIDIKRRSLTTIQRSLKVIARMHGFIPFSPEAQECWNKWALPGVSPAVWLPPVEDPMLRGYAVRRGMHAGKLALIIAAARHPIKARIEVSDVERAMEILFEAEVDMPRAVSGAGGNIYRLREENIVSFITDRYGTTKKAVPEWQVRQRLGRLIPMHMMNAILDGLIDGRGLKAIGKTPNRLLRPGELK